MGGFSPELPRGGAGLSAGGRGGNPLGTGVSRHLYDLAPLRPLPLGTGGATGNTLPHQRSAITPRVTWAVQVWGDWLLLCHLNLDAQAKDPAWLLGGAALRKTVVPTCLYDASSFLGPVRVGDLLGQVHLTTKIMVTKVARRPVCTRRALC